MITALQIHDVTEIRVKRSLIGSGRPGAFHTVDVVFITADGEMTICAFTGADEVLITGDLTEGATA